MTKPSNDVRERIQLITDPAYQGAYFTSDKAHDESKCWEPCGELGKSMEHAKAVPEITESLVAKLVTLVHYCEMERSGLLSVTARLVRDRVLDDAEVSQWAEQHKNELLYTVRRPR